ncbi:unnamed protein product [Arctogadus glacialis]
MAEGRTEEACHGLLTGERLPQHEMTLYRYFCMATLTITHRVPEETVVDFKVTEWNDRQVSAGVGATIYFRDGADRAVISVDEERWFGAYFTAIRPLYLTRQGEAADDKGCFFLGTTGLPVANPRSDLCRLWRHCRKICEGAGPNPPPVTAEATGTSSRDQSSVSGKGSRDDQWDAFVSEFPVTIGALAPSNEDLVGAGFGDERTPYFKWRRIQLEKRVLHVSGFPFEGGALDVAARRSPPPGLPPRAPRTRSRLANTLALPIKARPLPYSGRTTGGRQTPAPGASPSSQPPRIPSAILNSSPCLG